jgi:hypothetical protein
MKPLTASGAILTLLALSACATPATPPIADSACTAFKRISYAVPPVQPDGTRNVPMDTGNRFDTPETVKEVSEHNARFEAACP